jgi:hypothetical protein
MHDESSPAATFDELSRDVVYLLTSPDRHPPIWSVDDVGREIETHDPMAVIRPLCGAGLVHRTSDYIFATPAAYRMVELIGQVA